MDERRRRALDPFVIGFFLIFIGGLQYGYNIGIVGARLDDVEASFPMSAAAVGGVASAALAGAIVGSPLSGQ